ncbi:MAG: LysM peptidoglycan-binding domain-containing protein [Flavobacterium sp.]|jgi:LysM repeat protein|nr:LysM peptidoglycan-binding domain-containing protein [Flavobacterium sp.]MBP7181515.1 LysM peptidoglycan-binding domain-containing protein [Flavobacterium sp.]MBP7317974.1 LysM peptidoglycan-binding domain-containing protein [Flavobacterium sp.]MBP8886413.1 LysM peptidoglycan-binding domain-containing protein [Flavobacterium sp.]
MTTLLFNYSAFAQGKTTTHKVEKGETITQIALKYKTTPTAIYKINPDSQSGIQENQILSIPDGILQQKNNLVHIVGPKETLYGLATKYNVKIEALRNANEESLINGLKIGQELLIPKFSEQDKSAINPQISNTDNSKSTHKVLPKESFFSIARLYNVSVQDLDNANSDIFKIGLQVGQNLVIPNKRKTLDGRARIINSETIFHDVQPKETKYAIAKKYGITIEQLESQNPEIVNGLIQGNKLAINVKQITPSNKNEELMIALAEKEVAEEKAKAKNLQIEDLKDKLTVQKEINQKVIKVNNLKVNLNEIDGAKEGSEERLRLVLEANKNIQDILISKLDSLVYTMNEDLSELKNTEIEDLERSKQLEAQSYESISKTSQLSLQLKKDLAENRKVYSGLMNKAQRIALEKNNEYKKKVRENSKADTAKPNKEVAIIDIYKKMELDQARRDELNEALLKKIDSLGGEKKIELKRRISKATFYSREARNFDDKLALVRLKKYQNEAQKSQSQNTVHKKVNQLNLREIKEAVEQDTLTAVNRSKIQVLDNLKEVPTGYYIVLGDFIEAEDRDQFIMKLIDTGEFNSSFFFNVNILSYYVFTKFFYTEEEALYEYKQKSGQELYEKMLIVKIVQE